jgi:hypothetical protein
MIKKIKPIGMMFMVLVLVSAFVPEAFAGDLEPPAGPDDPGSAMYTLEDAYNRLDTGAEGAKRTGGFVGPTSPPGSTGVTLDEVIDMIPAADDAAGAAPEDVATGKTYWSLRTDGTWGQQTGASPTCVTCSGTLSDGGRWCDQNNGTVLDMTTGLVWLKDAFWGGQYALWANTTSGTNAHDRAAQVQDGTPASLTDGSVEGDWRLPTKEELHSLANGSEAIRSSSPGPFTNVQASYYRSSTTYSSSTNYAWIVDMTYGYVNVDFKINNFYVWPVRSGN